ncbi:endonuclease/exonuclease/phosphatase family protein [Sulfurovum sp.]|uniref:endonuclease/exonuclease/phosphatase family protein n=1 Tax=Sulfurovum sp. TaxID=1969726 RepID=UPI0025DD95F1|nr:endonuclease/exonuclease/phosphatase family protein [Sulfurovum sp.]
MFVPSILHHRSCRFSCNRFVPDTFGVLCWNVYKKNTKHLGFKPYLQKLTDEEAIDFLLLQEAHFRDDRHFTLPDFAFDAAANLEIRGEFYGVLSASRIESKTAQAYLSEGRESLIGPHKSLLLSSYAFEDGSTLLILNVHAINFRENQGYHRELERFLELMKDHKGAMIIAGDFNSWNKKRIEKLHEIREKLGLEAVPFAQKDKVKSFMGNHLDFIFYRGVELQKYSVYPEHGLSDHNPLVARFKKKP